MKLVLFAAVLSLATTAQAAIGVISGHCATFDGTTLNQRAFTVNPDSKVILGAVGRDGGLYQIEIVNNTMAPKKEQAWGAALVFSMGSRRPVFENPSELCNTRPRDLACERRNEERAERLKGPARDSFTTIENDGRPNPLDYYGVEYFKVQSADLVDGATYTSPTFQFVTLDMQCTATFQD